MCNLNLSHKKSYIYMYSISLSLPLSLENQKLEGPEFSIEKSITTMGFFGWDFSSGEGRGVHGGLV